MLNKNPLRILVLTTLCVVLGSISLQKGLAQNEGEAEKKAPSKKAALAEKKATNADSNSNRAEVGQVALVLDPVPKQFELWVDRLGFSWQLNQAGGLQSGLLNYIHSGMALSTNEQPYISIKGKRLDGGEVKDGQDGRVVLAGEAAKVKVERDIWFDQKRGGLRYIDSFSNEKGKNSVPLTVQLKTSFRATWQDLHGSSGRILGGRDAVELGLREHAVLVKYGRTEGRPDMVFLLAGEGDVKRPKISFSSNHRELTFTYHLQVPAGGKVALIHWVMQRNLSSPDEVSEALRPFYLRQRLLQAKVKRSLVNVVANFPKQALPEHTVQPYSLESLVALKEATHGYGAQRLWEDVIWISVDNQLAGVVNEKARLKIKTALGDRSVLMAQVAAIRGGGGVGRKAQVFLRDGQVLAGDIRAEELTMTSRDGWDMELKVEELMFLLTALKEVDGKAPENFETFVAMRSGDVLAVDAGEGSQESSLGVLTAWGEDRVPLSEIESLRYTNGGVPKYRLHQKDGSKLSVFLDGGDLELRVASGESIKFKTSEVKGMWRVGKQTEEGRLDGDEWLSFEDIGKREDLPKRCFLLAGSNLLQGEFAMEVLHLVSGGTVTKLNPAEIVSIESIDNLEAIPIFNIELSGGNRLKGSLRERSLMIKRNSRTWEIPVQHFISYLNQEVK